MFPFRRILHPTDFSPQSNHAFQLACAMAHEHGAKLTVLHVLDIPAVAYVNGMMPAFVAPPAEELRQQLERIQPPESDVAVEHVLREGTPAQEIIAYANDQHFDLIVMGAHGRGFLGRMILGTVAEGVVRKAHCPVLMVREPVDFQVEPLAVEEELAGV